VRRALLFDFGQVMSDFERPSASRQSVIASEAKQSSEADGSLDCFVASRLAMTAG